MFFKYWILCSSNRSFWRTMKTVYGFSSLVLNHEIICDLTHDFLSNKSLNNFYKFIPLIPHMSKRGIRKISQRLLDRTILLDRTLTYQTEGWFNSMLTDSPLAEMLTYDNMCTMRLYNKKEFQRFLKDATRAGFRYYTQLGNMITLEMRMRKDKLKEGL